MLGRMVCSLFLLALMCTAGCDRGDKIDLAAVDAPLRAMCDRHDKYIKADTSLPQVEKDIALRTSDLVRKTLDTAQRKVKPVANKNASDLPDTHALEAAERRKSADQRILEQYKEQPITLSQEKAGNEAFVRLFEKYADKL